MSSRDCPVHKLEMPCYKCKHINEHSGHGKKQLLRELNDLFKPTGYILTGPMDAGDFRNALIKVANDEPRAAAIAADQRRPKGTDKFRFGAAIRAAAGEPMLNAHRDSIRLGLDPRKLQDFNRSKAPAITGDPAYIVVKPTCMMTAKYGRNSAFWGERLWKVYRLKYAPGFLIRTDIGDSTASFKTMGELFSAVNKSGWERIR